MFKQRFISHLEKVFYSCGESQAALWEPKSAQVTRRLKPSFMWSDYTVFIKPWKLRGKKLFQLLWPEDNWKGLLSKQIGKRKENKRMCHNCNGA